jgi:hypothetical protein
MTAGKRCPKCSETKPTSAFGKDATQKSGLRIWCKLCHAAAQRDRKRRAGALPRIPRVTPEGLYRCPKCKEAKPATEFYKAANGKSTISSYCKSCTHVVNIEVSRAIGRKPKKYLNPDATEKECASCHVVKPIDTFHRDRTNTDGLWVYCKDCQRRLKAASRVHDLTAAFSHFYQVARTRARSKSLPFTITKQDLADIWTGDCTVCRVPLTFSSGPIAHTSPSLDRVRGPLGYTRTNIAWLCFRCNRRKAESTLEELQAIVDYVTRFV